MAISPAREQHHSVQRGRASHPNSLRPSRGLATEPGNVTMACGRRWGINLSGGGPQSVTRSHGHGFGVFRSESLAVRILLAQFAEQSLRQGILFFTARGEGKDNFGERPEIAAVFRGPGDLLHAELFVAVNSIKPEQETRTSALRPDNVICDAGGDVRVCRVWMLRQQFLRISVSFFHLLEAGEMPFLQNRFRIPFNSGGKRQCKKGFSIVGICFLALPGKFAGASESIAKMAHAPQIRAAVNPTQEFLFVQEKIAGQYALAG